MQAGGAVGVGAEAWKKEGPREGVPRGGGPRRRGEGRRGGVPGERERGAAGELQLGRQRREEWDAREKGLAPGSEMGA